jgi:hypothetical protein
LQRRAPPSNSRSSTTRAGDGVSHLDAPSPGPRVGKAARRPPTVLPRCSRTPAAWAVHALVDAALACQRTRRADGVVVLKGPVGWIVICRRRVRVTSRARQGGTPCMCVGSFRNADARATLKKQPLCTVLSPVLLAFMCCIIYQIGFDL